MRRTTMMTGDDVMYVRSKRDAFKEDTNWSQSSTLSPWRKKMDR